MKVQLQLHVMYNIANCKIKDKTKLSSSASKFKLQAASCKLRLLANYNYQQRAKSKLPNSPSTLATHDLDSDPRHKAQGITRI
jgi:hypothetical protein